MQLEEQIEKIVEGPLKNLGYNLVRVKLRGQGRPVLQIMAERLDETGMAVEDCELISRNISAILDVEDPISGEYDLEVSSPGIDRPLTKLEDFTKYSGTDIKLSSIIPVLGAKKFKGRLLAVEEGAVIIKTHEPEQEVKIDFNNISSASLDLEAKMLSKVKPGKKMNNKKGAKNGS